MSERDWKLFIMDMLVNRDVLEILTYLRSCKSGNGGTHLKGISPKSSLTAGLQICSER
jgi:hypothetical protein